MEDFKPMIDEGSVMQMLGHLRSIAEDDEAAHSYEDMMREYVLTAIAEKRCYSPERCAALALSSSEIKFARWCA